MSHCTCNPNDENDEHLDDCPRCLPAEPGTIEIAVRYTSTAYDTSTGSDVLVTMYESTGTAGNPLDETEAVDYADRLRQWQANQQPLPADATVVHRVIPDWTPGLPKPAAPAPMSTMPLHTDWLTKTMDNIEASATIENFYPRTYAYQYLRDHAEAFGIAEGSCKLTRIGAWLRFQLRITNPEQPHCSPAYTAVLAKLADAYLLEHGQWLPDDVKASKLAADAVTPSSF